MVRGARARISVVVGGQYGSEAKGHCVDWLARPDEQITGAGDAGVVGVRIGGSNAGHVVVDEQERRWALRQVPVPLVSNKRAMGVIAAGSEIDPEVLLDEIDQLHAAGYEIAERLMIDDQATVVEEYHIDAEHGGRHTEMIGAPRKAHGHAGLTKQIGSTGKGIGAARATRAMRNAKTVGQVWQTRVDWTYALVGQGVRIGDTSAQLREWQNQGRHIIIEGTQGYGLGLHAGYYPYCTSADCRAIDALAQAGINPWQDELGSVLDIWVVLRPYPIRVAGNSGPMQSETNWETLGLEPEKTTVTQKIRRVGEWDPELARAAVAANGGVAVKIFLSMADQVVPEIAGISDNFATTRTTTRDALSGIAMRVGDLIRMVESDTGARVWAIGTGPRTEVTWRSRGARAGQRASSSTEDISLGGGKGMTTNSGGWRKR